MNFLKSKNYAIIWDDFIKFDLQGNDRNINFINKNNWDYIWYWYSYYCNNIKQSWITGHIWKKKKEAREYTFEQLQEKLWHTFKLIK